LHCYGYCSGKCDRRAVVLSRYGCSSRSGSRQHGAECGSVKEQVIDECACSEQMCPNYRVLSADTRKCALSFPTTSRYRRRHLLLLSAGRK
jgi:hypothetical protein